MFDELFKNIANSYSTISEVSLSDNVLTDEIIYKFSQALQNNKSVKIVNLRNCELTDEKLKLLSLGITQSLATIIKVNLDDNPKITDDGRLHIIRALHSKLVNDRIEGIQVSVVRDCLNSIPLTPVSPLTNKDVVLIVGTTGSGKSTIINYLLGAKLELKLDDCGEQQVVATPEFAKIGHGMNSETKMPELYQAKGENYSYCDCSGFEDNRGEQQQILSALNMSLAMESYRYIRMMIVVVDYNVLNIDKGNSFRRVLQNINHMLGGLEKHEGSIFIAFNKVPKNIELKHIVIKLNEIKRYIESNNPDFHIDKSLRDVHKMLCYFLKNYGANWSKILLIDPLDNGPCREMLIRLINKSNIIQPSDFNFAESDVVEMKTIRFAETIIMLILQLIDYFIAQAELVKDCSSKILKYRQELENISKVREEINGRKVNLEKQLAQEDAANVRWLKNAQIIGGLDIDCKNEQEMIKQSKEKIAALEQDMRGKIDFATGYIQVCSLLEGIVSLQNNIIEHYKLKLESEKRRNNANNLIKEWGQQIEKNDKIIADLTVQIVVLDQGLKCAENRFSIIKELLLDVYKSERDNSKNPPGFKISLYVTIMRLVSILKRFQGNSNLYSTFCMRENKYNKLNSDAALNAVSTKTSRDVIVGKTGLPFFSTSQGLTQTKASGVTPHPTMQQRP